MIQIIENKNAGVYCIQSKIKPERIYIGSTKNFRQRSKEHLNCFLRKNHYNKKLQRHIDKYGIDDLEIFVIEECDKDYILDLEQIHMDLLAPYFNQSKYSRSILDYKPTDVERKKSNEKRIGYKHTPEAIEKIRAAGIGRIPNEETRAKLSACKTGFVYSAQARENMSKAHIGKKQSEEGKRKMSETRTGRKWTEKMIKSQLTKKRKANTKSKYWCVSKGTGNDGWTAKIYYNGIRKHIGYYKTEDDAARAYNDFVISNNLVNKPLNVIL